MTAEREDFVALMKRKAAEQQPQFDVRPIQQAAVQAEYLTGSEYWDVYLRYLQSAIEHTENMERGFLEALAAPLLVETDKILKAKIALLECRASIKAWKSAIELPKQLIDNGGKADEWLKQQQQEEAV